MANTLGIPEVTLAQLSSGAHIINKIDTTGAVAGTPRKSAYQPVVVRVSDHNFNDASATDDPTKMALFTSVAHGHPWIIGPALQHLVLKADDDPVTNPTDSGVTTLYPNFDYADFS